MCPFVNMLWFPSYTAKVFLRARHVSVRGWEILFPLCAALAFDRLHLCGASSSARKSERIYELGRLRLTSRGEVPSKKHALLLNYKSCECHFLFKACFFSCFWFQSGHSFISFGCNNTIGQFLHQTLNLLNLLRACEGSTFALPRIHLKGEPGNEIVATCEEVEM